MKGNGSTTSNILEIREEAIGFFTSSIGTRDQIDQQRADQFLENIPHLVRNDHNDYLLSPIKDEEIKKVVFEMAGEKALGPDGFPAIFFQKNLA